MAYKFQIGSANLSGTLVIEADISASTTDPLLGYVSASRGFVGDGSKLTAVSAGAADNDTEIMYNDGGDLAGLSSFTLTKATGLVNAAALTIAGNTTLGDASGDSVTINAATINPANIAAGTDNTVVVYNGSTLLTDEIDSKVWDGALIDYTGTPANNQLGIWTDTDTLEGDANLVFGAGGMTGLLEVSGTHGPQDLAGIGIGVQDQSANGEYTGLFRLAASDGANELTLANQWGATTQPCRIVLSSSHGVSINAGQVTASATSMVWQNAAGSEEYLNIGADGDVSGSGEFNINSIKVNSGFEIGSQLYADGRAQFGGVVGVTGTLMLASVSEEADNTVLVLNATNEVRSDEIDSKVWGTTLVQGSATNNQVVLWSSTDEIDGSSNFTYDGTTITLGDATTIGGALGDDIKMKGSWIYEGVEVHTNAASGLACNTIVSGTYILCNGAVEIGLPADPDSGRTVYIKRAASQAADVKITGSGGKDIDGEEEATLGDSAAAAFIFESSTDQWHVF